jgi:molybdopterin-binding protein
VVSLMSREAADELASVGSHATATIESTDVVVE